MKKVLVFLSLVFSFFLFTPKAKANSSPYGYDKIKEYSIHINPNSDATLDMEVYIKWDVLKNNDDGSGVTDAYIGCANSYVYNLQICEDSNIRSINYEYKNGSTICCKLNSVFYKGSSFILHYKYTQSRIFYYNKSVDRIEYNYIPGWFNYIDIENMNIYWKTSPEYYYASTDTIDGEYLFWHKDYSTSGSRSSYQIAYEKGAFPNVNLKEGYKETKDPNRFIPLFVFVGTIALLVLVCVINACSKKYDYYSARGFYPDDDFYHHRVRFHGVSIKGTAINTPNPTKPVSSGSHGHSGHSCACACACACAGGGRAGCSRKDFYKFSTKFPKK